MGKHKVNYLTNSNCEGPAEFMEHVQAINQLTDIFTKSITAWWSNSDDLCQAGHE